jgi:CysZ protein
MDPHSGYYLFLIILCRYLCILGQQRQCDRLFLFCHWLEKDVCDGGKLAQIPLIFSQVIIQLVFILFYFSLFKFLFLIIGSPLFAYLSEKTASIMENREFPFSFAQILKDIARGIRLALRNAFWQSVYVLTILILSFVPFIGWFTPLFALLVECFYLGFSMLDYSSERNKWSPSQSVAFIGDHKGLAIGNGIVFYLMHTIIVAGWILAPSYAVVAATISMHKTRVLWTDEPA